MVFLVEHSSRNKQFKVCVFRLESQAKANEMKCIDQIRFHFRCFREKNDDFLTLPIANEIYDLDDELQKIYGETPIGDIIKERFYLMGFADFLEDEEKKKK